MDNEMCQIVGSLIRWHNLYLYYGNYGEYGYIHVTHISNVIKYDNQCLWCWRFECEICMQIHRKGNRSPQIHMYYSYSSQRRQECLILLELCGRITNMTAYNNHSVRWTHRFFVRRRAIWHFSNLTRICFGKISTEFYLSTWKEVPANLMFHLYVRIPSTDLALWKKLCFHTMMVKI